MMKHTPDFDVMYKREALQRERYEQKIIALNNTIDKQAATIKEQQDIIGRLRQELKYKNNLIERMTNVANIPNPDKPSFFKRIFHKNKN